MTGRLFDALEWTPASTSLEAHNELHKAIRASDRAGIVELVERGAVLPNAKPGDGIRVLDSSVWNWLG